MTDNETNPGNNGAILTVVQKIKRVMTSAAKAELSMICINAQEAIYILRVLEEIGHPQPRTPIQTDNSTAEGLINGKVLPRHLKSMDKDLLILAERPGGDGKHQGFLEAGAHKQSRLSH